MRELGRVPPRVGCRAEGLLARRPAGPAISMGTWLTVIVAGWAWAADPVAAASPRDVSAFASQVDLSKIRLIAVQDVQDGRLKTFDSFARYTVQMITHDEDFGGQDPVFTYLDAMFRPSAYARRNWLYVKLAPVREAIIRAAGDAISEGDVEAIRRGKRVSPMLLRLPQVRRVLDELERDVRATGRAVEQLQNSAALADASILRSRLLILPVPGADPLAAWRGADALAGAGGAPQDAAHAAVTTAPSIPGLDEPLASDLASAWRQLQTGWVAQDAGRVNEALARLAAALPQVEPRVYPPHRKLIVEHWYYASKKMTWGWLIYAFAAVCLLLAFVQRGRLSRRIGMAAFFVAFVLHTVSIGVRWYLAGRIPNANMFEAVMAAVWFGAALALVLEVWLRRRPMRNLFALGASVCAMAAMMCGQFMPVALNSNISNPMPILHTVWLKIHTNLIILSYALIGMAFVTALMYLVVRWVARRRRPDGSDARSGEGLSPAALYDGRQEFRAVRPSGFVLPERRTSPTGAVVTAALSLVGAGGLAWVLRGELTRAAAAMLAFETAGRTIVFGAYMLLLVATILFGTPLLVWLVTGVARIVFGRDAAELDEPACASDEFPGRFPGRLRSMAAVLDGTTMILMELAFITLWVGIILGAAWADVSWGRPWGWDPKEVFALNTWIIFLILVHVRLKVQDKGLWTAVLAVAGFVVMMFNWIGVNFFIVGLHSYA